MILVNNTFLPPVVEYQKLLEEAWVMRWITNRGKIVLQLEECSRELSNRVLGYPLYFQLPKTSVLRISQIISKSI